MLVDAPFSALNNQGSDSGDRTEHIVRTKVVRRGREIYPYVSGQAIRYWWRTTLEKECQWELSPIEREKKIAFTAANPVQYPDDDMFGYMKAPAKRGKETVTRISPLKVSPLISVFPTRPVTDFGVMARHEGDPVPYEHEFYSTIFKGIFSIDINNVGRFYQEKRSGKRNFGDTIPEEIKNKLTGDEDGSWVLPIEKRKKRITDTISVIPYLYGGAKLASHLTNVAPSFIILGMFSMGNHVLYHTIGSKDSDIILNDDAITQMLKDYGDRLLTNLYIGKQSGFNDGWSTVLQELESKDEKGRIKVLSVKNAVNEFIKDVEAKIEF